MRNRKTQGFTLIELLIVIAIIGILAAVLIPNLLNARARAFDTAAQTCLKEIGANEEMLASTNPWQYSGAALINDGAVPGPLAMTIGTAPNTLAVSITSCDGVTVVANTADMPAGETNLTWYGYNASHENGANTYSLVAGAGVRQTATGTL